MHTICKKGIISLSLALLMIFGAVAGAFRPVSTTAAEDYRMWTQLDGRWINSVASRR